ncbi:MAG: DUF2000 domain-containing protein [Candidatus Peribacteraceae bacterium]|jgi:hypothetical protein|nr:DUF2000 domain-containing protein [Candidatus Peribacteraceae bacterium]MDP7645898.1 DUF2000 domain-containing protein [Candidatus Peribacteraceae bacterium]|tara:strand:+ start:863 stop:1270 length:408 start_codon:yes stop_codon:yes gene_type:complete
MDKKCVIVLDQELPVGLLANSSAVLSLTLGEKIDGIIDRDINDGSGEKHEGITNTVIPILKTEKENLTIIREKAVDLDDVLVVDFSDVAQRTKTYDDYAAQLEVTKSEDLRYLGIALYGEKQAINSLTGSLALLR